jgi:hypothetical protein
MRGVKTAPHKKSNHHDWLKTPVAGAGSGRNLAGASLRFVQGEKS